MPESYPGPLSRRLALVATTRAPEFNTRAEYEEHIFRRADHFNVVRYGAYGSEIATVCSFAEALYLASREKRALIYAVDSSSGNAFCVARSEWPRYADITLEMRDALQNNPPR